MEVRTGECMAEEGDMDFWIIGISSVAEVHCTSVMRCT